MAHIAYLLLGSNLGNRTQVLKNAASQIKKAIGDISVYSSVYETGAWGIENQPAFLNQVVIVNTTLKPQDLLKTINTIEVVLGRVRHKKWGERLIDIDILYYDNIVMDTHNLVIPHPEISNRRFTLFPLVEIASIFIHPILRKTHSALLETCKDKLGVKKYQET